MDKFGENCRRTLMDRDFLAECIDYEGWRVQGAWTEVQRWQVCQERIAAWRCGSDTVTLQSAACSHDFLEKLCRDKVLLFIY